MAEPTVRPLPVFVRETFGELTSLNGPLLKSISTLVRAPGQLTVDYLAGKRAEYLTPVRLFIDVGVGAFLLSWLIPQPWPLFGIGPELFGDTTIREALGAAAVVPLGTAAHWLALRRYRSLVMEHAVFVLHVTTFSFMLAPMEGLLYLVVPASPWLQTTASLFAPVAWGIYWFLALARFLDKPVRAAITDGFRVYLVTLALLIPTILFLYFAS